MLDPGLADLLIADAGHEPGALPLLPHALRATWERRAGSRLTVAGYRVAGGIRDAVACTAEAAYAALASQARTWPGGCSCNWYSSA